MSAAFTSPSLTLIVTEEEDGQAGNTVDRNQQAALLKAMDQRSRSATQDRCQLGGARSLPDIRSVSPAPPQWGLKDVPDIYALRRLSQTAVVARIKTGVGNQKGRPTLYLLE
jgi:hypothetical protein